jgi:hypothetical protein
LNIAVAAGSRFPVKNYQSQNPSSDKPLNEQALEYIEKNGTMSVQDLYDSLKIRYASLTKADLANLVLELAEQEKISLADSPLTTTSLGEYLHQWERNLWLYGSLAVSLGTALMAYASVSEFPFVALRWILGSVFVLFIPGYVAVEVLFPGDVDLNWIERLALSIGLSLALVPLVGFLLSYASLGVRLTSIMGSLTILSIGLSAVALVRKYMMTQRES